MKRVDPTEFENIFIRRTALIDVRSPSEFQLGSIPGATNLPLLTDVERHQVGLTYKVKGPEAAVELGHELVSGSVKQDRIDAWLKHLDRHPDALVYCFRGGLRSEITQTWLRDHKRDVAIVDGGYKALRQYLMRTIETLTERLSFEVVCGPTGSGKTRFLFESQRPFIDLEALAAHRGSAFGAMTETQPAQIDFENRIAVELLRLSKESGPILIEDESQQIGHRLIPSVLFQKMKVSPRLVIDVPIETRVDAILSDYVLNSKLGALGDVSRFNEFRKSVGAISRKLGGARTKEILFDIDVAQTEFESQRTFESNRIWIKKLLEWYYDPFYNFATDRNQPKA